MKKTLTISQEEYENLKEDCLLLKALYEAGLSNWEWYSDAVEEFYNTRKVDKKS